MTAAAITIARTDAEGAARAIMRHAREGEAGATGIANALTAALGTQSGPLVTAELGVSKDDVNAIARCAYESVRAADGDHGHVLALGGVFDSRFIDVVDSFF